MSAPTQSDRSLGGPRARNYDPQLVHWFCWAALSHMLGRNSKSTEFFATLTAKARQVPDRDPVDRVVLRAARAIRAFQTACEPSKRLRAHGKLTGELDTILHAGERGNPGPRLGRECRRSRDGSPASESARSGYSRDPFKRIGPVNKPAIAMASVCYLLRAYASFFSVRRLERDFNTGKTALNDLFQASNLACRLYYSMGRYSHLEQGTQDRYFDAVREGLESDRPPWSSPFFVWSLLQLVELQRGNVYRQIENLSEADRYFRHVRVRFFRLLGESKSLDVHLPEMVADRATGKNTECWFITTTLVRALSEGAKVLFDQGRFIESLMYQVRCLVYLVRIARGWSLTESEVEKLKSISAGMRFLNVVRRESVWKKGLIWSYFGLPSQSKSSAPFLVLRDDEFLNWLKSDRAEQQASREIRRAADREAKKRRELAVDLYARIGLTLFILRREAAIDPEAEDTRQLMWFFDVAEILGVDRTPMALDGRAIACGKADGVSEESIERGLSRRLRGATPHGCGDEGPASEKAFCVGVLESATRSVPNMMTIPRRVRGYLLRLGYRERRRNPRDKLVVLRRWQSFNPKIPRPNAGTIRGGGYLLLWHGKGVVIDPGYDFVQNLYDEGFSLGDIDAVIVTHSHPDHDDDLSTLTTLVREWNEYHHSMGREHTPRKLDFLLNESAHLKFAAWLKASRAGVARVIPLPLVAWDLDSTHSIEHPRGEDARIKLRYKYRFDLEVVPAWHDDVIGHTSAVGLKLHLFNHSNDRQVGVIGYTGDTGAYELASQGKARDEYSAARVEDRYQECDVLVAHVGDARLRELFTVIGGSELGSCVGQLLEERCCGDEGRPRISGVEAREFLDLLVNLNLAQSMALEGEIQTEPKLTVAQALGRYIETEKIAGLRNRKAKSIEDTLIRLADEVFACSRGSGSAGRHRLENGIRLEIRTRVTQAIPSRTRSLDPERIAYVLLGFLCALSEDSWEYKYHLGCRGIFRIHQAMVNCEGPRTEKRVLVVGELPEELASYRHHVARLLGRRRGVHAFTGDIGLHIGLDADTWLEPTIRCTFCNCNNETAAKRANYHPPDKILETSLKRLNSAMIYLCTTHDHHPNERRDFLSRPSLRVI